VSQTSNQSDNFNSKGIPMRRIIQLPTVLILGAASLAQADGLVLWNKLGSNSEILNSAYGPNLSFYGGGFWPDVTANPAYGPGAFGNALTIGPGGYGTFDRVHNVIWNNVNSYLNSECGAVEVWFKQNSTPVDYQNGIYRIFDGGFGRGSGIGLESVAGGLSFSVYFGGAYTTVQQNISALNGNWIHVAGVWDRAGIDGSGDRVRLYVDGAVVASSASGGWGNIVGTEADIAGANDYNIVGQFYEDNLKVYDFAMTDFSHRFEEGWIVPEPTALALCGLGSLVVFRFRKVQRI
jgi:hypothetical protein